jgi:hypothetical protein
VLVLVLVPVPVLVPVLVLVLVLLPLLLPPAQPFTLKPKALLLLQPLVLVLC